MKRLREFFGYLLGCLLFVVLIPTVMWFVSGRPPFNNINTLQALGACLLMFGGLTLSVWTIVYMKHRGKGNPMDAFGHEVAPRTQNLMTDGPYHINRNPMLTGTLLYLAGVAVWLWTWPAVIVWAAFLAIMIVQVLSEEHRLQRDFGDEYTAYRQRTSRF